MSRIKDKLTQTQRLEAIRRELLRADEVSIDDLAGRFGVSGMTVRRDLELLESHGDVIRTHGGAALAKRLTFEFSFRQKQNRNSRQKLCIARRAAGHVKDGQVVILDTGTTTLEIARQLTGRDDVTVITTSLAIVSTLQFAAGLRTVLLGGFLRGGSPDLHGPLTEQNVEMFRADLAFMGADAVDLDGNMYADDLQVVNLDRKMAANAARVIVVADSSKFGRRGMCRILGPDDYDSIISDPGLGKDMLKRLARKGVQVELAEGK
ncbi:MAG: DeoR/GlpR transcriptional regulator [Sedimentisphaerales bacterium]|nr:DeoR/GlpR transcriptional regulator [Sedimentisphaerales bacterium]